MDIIEKALNKKKLEAANLNSLHTKTNASDELYVLEDESSIVAAAPEVKKIEEKQPKPSQIGFQSEIEPLIKQDFAQDKRTSDDIKPTSLFVEINKENLSEMGFIVAEDENSLINEEFRRIKGPLLRNIKGKSAHPIERANLIQVTSSLQSEGKTYNAINLAMSIAMELDYKVLLVDADVIKPSVANTLDIETDKGLIEYLSGDVECLSEVLLSTNISKLTILPAGQKNNLSVELFNSDVMMHLFNELSERYSDRIVIIDSPPILLTNEATILAQKVGQLVFVIEHNTTEMSNVEQAIEKLPADAVIGVVLNKARSGQIGTYNYGYGYGYGSE